MTAQEVFDRLLPSYPPEGWWPSASPFETAVGAVLVQGVAWRNAALAVANLRAADLLREAALAETAREEIAARIRPALYHNQKSEYLRALARFCLLAGGIEAVAAWPLDAQRAALLSVRGIGPETASAIMVYALGGAEPVVDAYAMRILLRTGAQRTPGPEGTLRAMRQVIRGDAARARAMHALLVEHARSVCRPKPDCAFCPIADTCPRLLGETQSRRWAHGRRAGSAASQGEGGDRAGAKTQAPEGAGGARTRSMG